MSNYRVSISAPSEWCLLGAGVEASEVGGLARGSKGCVLLQGLPPLSPFSLLPDLHGGTSQSYLCHPTMMNCSHEQNKSFLGEEILVTRTGSLTDSCSEADT